MFSFLKDRYLTTAYEQNMTNLWIVSGIWNMVISWGKFYIVEGKLGMHILHVTNAYPHYWALLTMPRARSKTVAPKYLSLLCRARVCDVHCYPTMELPSADILDKTQLLLRMNAYKVVLGSCIVTLWEIYISSLIDDVAASFL